MVGGNQSRKLALIICPFAANSSLSNEVRRAVPRPQIDFQSLLTSMGHRLSEEMIEQCSIP
jgi:Ca2+-binding EF-hand superfamily protein